MEETNSSYDWEDYYKAAYEKEKKKNNNLAMKVADAQAKGEELKENLERIEKSIFWKMTAPARKCYYAFFSKNINKNKNKSKNIIKKITDVMPHKSRDTYYWDEVFRQKHPYLQWITENEGGDMGGELKEPAPESVVNGWKKIELSNTELCIIVCGNGVLSEKAPEIIKSWFNNNKNCLFAYSDEDYFWEKLSNRMHPRFKPGWSPDTLLSFCYMGHMIIVRKSLYHGLMEGERFNSGSYQDFYKLCLLLEERALTLEEGDRLVRSLSDGKEVVHDRIGNIEQVLFHNRYEPDADEKGKIEAAQAAGADVLETVETLLQKRLDKGYDTEGCRASYSEMKEAALKRRGIKAHLSVGSEPDIYNICYDIEELKEEHSGRKEEGMVSVIIPSKDHPELLDKCLHSFTERTGYRNYEFIIVDNGSSPDNKAKVEKMQEKYGFTYIYKPMEFNFSAMCNLGALKAAGAYLLLLNDDIEVIQKDWLEIMLGQATQPHTGAVGAKLWYADSDIIQHAGITNMGIGPSHKLASLTDNKCYYYGRNYLTYNVAGVTAACLLIDKKKYMQAGGMDESMKVAYNDVDLCFRLVEAGYYNVLRNDAVLYHHESMSRGLDSEDCGKWERLLEEKNILYAKHPRFRGRDDFYNSNLNDDNINYTCNFKYDYMKKDRLIKPDLYDDAKLSKARTNGLHLVIDEADKQQKGEADEADIIVISGWSYIAGEDNAGYERNVILRNKDSAIYKIKPYDWYRKDVEKVLTGEVNILLSGFVLRIAKEELEAGLWEIGMIAEDAGRHKRFVSWSDKRLLIE